MWDQICDLEGSDLGLQTGDFNVGLQEWDFISGGASLPVQALIAFYVMPCMLVLAAPTAGITAHSQWPYLPDPTAGCPVALPAMLLLLLLVPLMACMVICPCAPAVWPKQGSADVDLGHMGA